MSVAQAMQAAIVIADADVTLQSLLGGKKVYWYRATTAVVAPWIVLVGTDDAEDDTLTGPASRVVLSFNIYTAKRAGPQAQTAIQARLLTSYHTVQPAAITGYTFGRFARVGGFQIDEPDEFVHFVEQYAVHVFAA